jgi:hypothetical protein
VYEQFAGSTDERNAGFVLQAYALNGAMDECMSEQGYPEWDWSLSREYAGPADPLGSDWFGALQRPYWSQNEMVMRDFGAAELVMNADDASPEYGHAVDRCLDLTQGKGSDESLEAASMPEGSPSLISQWDSMLMKAEEDLMGDTAPYWNCMDDSSIEQVKAGGQSYEEILPKISGMAAAAGPAPAVDADPSTYSTEWKEFLAIEQEVLDADEACRGDVYREHIGGLLPRIEVFARDHADQIEAADTGWRDIVSKAEELGYTGQSGPLNG